MQKPKKASEDNLYIPILINGKEVRLYIYGENSSEGLIKKDDALENGEAVYQIKEGFFYEYKITDGYSLGPSEFVIQSKANKSSGRIAPNIYVGTLKIDILDDDQNICGQVELEVQSVKTTYREDYRFMLEEITEKCADLLLQHNSPVSQNLEVDFNADARTLYQRFAFIKSVLDSPEFNDSVQKIISAPVTRWKENEIIKDLRAVRRFNGSAIRQLSSLNNRIKLPTGHHLKKTFHTMPTKIKVNSKTETVDTFENRFVKHALISFQSLCNDFKEKAKGNNRLKSEAVLLIDKLEHYLGHSIFKEISDLTTLPLNSPVLQRKEGYRELLRVWLMLDLAAKVVWRGGEDVYSGNKRDVAVLYEYWLFFKLLDLVKEVFKIEPENIENLIKPTDDGLGLQLRQGQYLPLKGVYSSQTRKLNVEFSYNKTFSGQKAYPDGGSWTHSLRPDYTLSIWPYGITAETAEREELIVHLHFDAKYKVEKLVEILGDDTSLNQEKTEQKKGIYKRADLLKMHTYKDAIRRTAGAYVLYPGTEGQYIKFGFHELIPGLGAFAIRPSKTDDGSKQLKDFLYDVVAHFENRASQRENMSYKVFETYRNPSAAPLNVLLPEAVGENRSLVPDETYVLVGFYKNAAHLKWILDKKLYNARTDSTRGSLRLGPGETLAKYLLLHSSQELITNKLFKITEQGPRVFSKETLIKKGYPSEPSQNYYLVYKVEEVTDKEFENQNWDIRQLKGYKSGRGSAIPFSVTLTELMKALVI